ncbi:MAG: hypothetical protein NZ839_01425, partial [Endomicrobia bacterium]|nr:hypothetical protein [Endomicrobiia bacterium]
CYEILFATNTSPTTQQVYVITNLAGKTTWYFVMKTADEAGNWSLMSNSTSSVEGYYDISVEKQIYEVTNSSRPSGEITYQITLRNTGNIKMYNVNIKDKTPDNCTYSTGTITLDGQPVSDDAGFDIQNNSLSLTIPELSVGQEKKVRFKVKIK